MRIHVRRGPRHDVIAPRDEEQQKEETEYKGAASSRCEIDSEGEDDKKE